MPSITVRAGATEADLEIRKGETFDIVFPVLDANSMPVTVDGWTAKAQIRRSPTEPLLHEWSPAQSNITVAGTGVTLHVVASATTAWAFTDARYDLEVTEPDAVTVHCIARGAVHVIDEITQ